MTFVFGPVPSRRLGQSLGIDPIPLKTCNWNCVYCQLGRTRPLTNERREYVPRQDLFIEIKQALATHKPGRIDWVTFVGSGEPTLHCELGWLIRQVKSLTNLPVAVITNGALLYLPQVRSELSAADAVLPSLDTGNRHLYRKINRPWPKLTFERLLEGLIAFRREYSGKLWVEVMLVKGLNDTEDALTEIASALRLIRPDQVHINTPVRPPAEPWVQPPGEDELGKALRILGDIARVVPPEQGRLDFGVCENLEEAILGIITRHPMREEDLITGLYRWPPERVKELLTKLKASGQTQTVERYGTRFWISTNARFPQNSYSGDQKRKTSE